MVTFAAGSSVAASVRSRLSVLVAPGRADWVTTSFGVKAANAGPESAIEATPTAAAIARRMHIFIDGPFARVRANGTYPPRGLATSGTSSPRCADGTASYNRPVIDRRPVGVFDSGVGGLTVLHECLVTMPHEDFVYLGDGARLPYGPRPLDETRRFAHEIAGWLEAQGVKLIVVACNTATSAALPELQERLRVPTIGVLTPEAHAAVLATRNRRIGLMATQGT